MATIKEFNGEKVGNVARLKTQGMFAHGNPRYAVSKFEGAKCSGHDYYAEHELHRARINAGEDGHLYDLRLRCRVRNTKQDVRDATNRSIGVSTANVQIKRSTKVSAKKTHETLTTLAQLGG